MSNKYMKEIEEILKRADAVMPKDSSRATKKGTAGSTPPLERLAIGGFKISAGKIMLTSFALLLLAMILGAIGVVSVVPIVAAGLILFVIGYALFFVRPGTSSYEKRWRGRVIEDQPTMWERVKRWLGG